MKTSTILSLGIALCLTLPLIAYKDPEKAHKDAAKPASGPPALWEDRGDPSMLNLLYGQGGMEHQPVGPYTFFKDDKAGSSPKFEITDGQGTQWKVKLGEESRAETAAAHLVWAAGYFTDEDYYIADLPVAQSPRLERGREFVSPDGLSVHGARLERVIKGQKKAGNWSWFKNPFTGSREMNGLRILMALINNWDLKEVNNDIYNEKDTGTRYVVSDLGASFGATGSSVSRSKSNFSDYRNTGFIQKVSPKTVDFYMSSRPTVFTAFNFPYYRMRTQMQAIAKDLPIEDAQWLGQRLAKLSSEQIRDCFRSAGYSPEDVEGFAKVVESRIADLNRLPEKPR